MDYKYLVETNILAQEMMTGIKSKTLLESIKDVEMISSYHRGDEQYIVNYKVNVDLSDMVDFYSDEGKEVESVLVDVLDNFYEKKDLDDALWNELKKIDGIEGVDFEVTIMSDIHNVKNINELKQKLKDVTFEVSVTILLGLDTEKRLELDKIVKQVLEKKLK